MKLRIPLICAGVGLAMLPGLAAHAVEDLTGTYEGTLRCVTTTAGVPSKSKQAVTVEVADNGDEGVTFEIPTVEDRIVGLVIQDAVKGEHGVLPAASCDYEAFDQEGLVARLAVRTKVGSEKASLKGTLLRTSLEDESSAICTLDAKRVSTTLPEVVKCVHVVPI
jgi:hypothetical protein